LSDTSTLLTDCCQTKIRYQHVNTGEVQLNCSSNITVHDFCCLRRQRRAIYES